MATQILVYNPDQKPKEEIIQEFVIRQGEFQTIFNNLLKSDYDHPPQHFLVQGQRGMGKTTLLLRVKYGIEDESTLRDWLLPVKFSEEQYHITHLENLWESIAEALESQYSGFEGLLSEIEKHERAIDFEELAAQLLVEGLRVQKKRVLVMIDNLGDLFGKFKTSETHRLRQVLLTSPEIQLIGASAYVLEHNFEYDKPFFEFFHHLPG